MWLKQINDLTAVGILRTALLLPPLRTTGNWFYFWTAALYLLALDFFYSYYTTQPPREYSAYAWQSEAAYVVLALLGGWLAALMVRAADTLALATYALYLMLIVTGLYFAAYELPAPVWDSELMKPLIQATLALFALLMATRLLLRVTRARWRALVASLLLAFGTMVPFWFMDNSKFWYQGDDEQQTQKTKRPYDAEQLLYAQPALLEEKLKHIAPSREGQADLFAIVAGGYGYQEIFKREVSFVAETLAAKFDAGERTLALLNNPATTTEMPLAILPNIARAAKEMALKAEPENDVLLVFLSSHGHYERGLSVDLAGVSLNDIRPDALALALKESGFRWKVIIISACYSGVFIPALKDDHTLVITAASADRTSWGCSDELQLTRFTESYFKMGLAKTHSPIGAYYVAAQHVREQERENWHFFSHPQIAEGKEMEAKLSALSGEPAAPWRELAKPTVRSTLERLVGW